jgi:hypothetical protein
VGLTISPPSVSQLSRKSGCLNVSQPYGPSWPVRGIAFLFSDSQGTAHEFIPDKFNVNKTMYRAFTGFCEKLQHKCSRCYISETSRPFEVCIKEHKYNLTQGLLEKSK